MFTKHEVPSTPQKTRLNKMSSYPNFCPPLLLDAENQPKRREFSTSYFLPRRISKKKTQVCQAMFLNVLDIHRDRVRCIAQVCFGGNIPKEGRGGDRVSGEYTDKKENSRIFKMDCPPRKVIITDENQNEFIWIVA
nr:unnamed protein product [Callosobruchus analis]